MDDEHFQSENAIQEEIPLVRLQSAEDLMESNSEGSQFVNVRMTVLSQGLLDLWNRKIVHVLSTIINLPQIIAIVHVLAKSKNWTSECPLGAWSLVYGIFLFVSLVTRCGMFFEGLDGRFARFHTRSRPHMEVFRFTWFMIGFFWVFDVGYQIGRKCQETQPEVYKLALILVIIHSIITMMPCCICIVGLPIIFFCTPRVIDFLIRFDTERGASLNDIRNLPTRIWQRGDETEQCAICLTDFESGEELRVLPCDETGRHAFHLNCIDRWLQVNDTCPICRSPVCGSREQGRRQERSSLISNPI